MEGHVAWRLSLHNLLTTLCVFTGISVERYTPVFQTGVEGAIPSGSSIPRIATVCEAPIAEHSRYSQRASTGSEATAEVRHLHATRNPGVVEDSTDQAAAGQLRLRVRGAYSVGRTRAFARSASAVFQEFQHGGFNRSEPACGARTRLALPLVQPPNQRAIQVRFEDRRVNV